MTPPTIQLLTEFSKLSHLDWTLLQERADQFAVSLRQDARSDWESYLGGLDATPRLALLYWMMKIDLEYCWSRGEHRLLDEYVKRHPEIGGADALPANVICEEYRIRARWGMCPDRAGYASRFPKQFDEVMRELDGEQSTNKGTVNPSTAVGSVMPSGPKAGNYEKTIMLGRGSFGEVWKAIAPGGVEVAIKVVTHAIDRQGAQRELHSLELVKNLRHSCLISTHGFWIENDRLHIAMELAECSLRDKFRECRSRNLPGIPRGELMYFFKCAAEGLDFLHSKGVIHRDVKPDNILLQQVHAKVADFGLARLQERAKLNESLVGTVRYMAPEALTGRGSGPRSDQYSLAYAYAEMRQGRPPIDADDQIEVMTKTIEGELDLEGLTSQEVAVVRKAMAQRPEERYSSCSEFVAALSDPTAEISSNWMKRGSDFCPRTPKTGKRRSVIAGIGIFVTLVFLASAAYFLIRPAEERPRVAPPEGGHPEEKPLREPLSEIEVLPMPRIFVKPPQLRQRIVNSVGMTLQLIKEGEFKMGSPDDEIGRMSDEGPAHLVKITKPFYIGICEVSVRQYTDVMGADFANDGEPDHPVIVSHQAANKFCQALTEKERINGRRYRLPTEAEWEYACRAGTSTPFSFGDHLGAEDAQVARGGGKQGVAPKGTCSIDAHKKNQWGLYNMHGNVWEWCSDLYSATAYKDRVAIDPRAPVIDPQGPLNGEEPEERVLRGGSYRWPAPKARSANRYKDDPLSTEDYGFRVVLTLESTSK
jgi:formylglycine-generating enzyme required for sulfatase activity/serine/threonine protein kinase